MSKYPGELDTDGELPPIADNITEIGADAINSLRAAVFAIERALGTSPQGTTSTLSARLAQSLNADGTFKAAALIAAGLIALPITNTQVGSSAAIQESKLDLDVPTQTLQNLIDGAHVDILALQDSLALDINNLARHTLGQIDRHDGYQIDITALSGHPSIDTVEAALDFIWGVFLDHKSATGSVEHLASAISYTPSGSGLITATNVQDAITSTDAGFIEDRRKHNDSAHSDGVSNDGYATLGGQAATNDPALRLTRYQTFAGGADIIKVGHPNAAMVKSKGFQPGAITATTNAFNIVITTSGAAERTLAITSLDISAYPSASSRITLEGVVDFINAQAATLTNHFPISAYASSDGELVIQHNIDRDDCKIKVTTAANSAISALGFSDIDGIYVGRIDNYYFVVNGSPYTELKVIATGTLTLALASSVIDLGVDVTGSGLGLFQNSLIHVFSHTDTSGPGTYNIAQVSPASPSPSTSIGLSTTVAAGTFSYVIYAECFNTNFVGSAKIMDLYIDDTRIPVVSQRGLVTFGGLGGVKIIELSPEFPAISSGTITLATSSGQKSLIINDGSTNGQATLFDAGYLGYLRVWAPDNRAYATVFVTDLAPVNGTDTIETFAVSTDDSKLFLGVSHSDASSTIELPLDRRNVGLVGSTAVGTDFIVGTLQRDIGNLHTNGVIRGLTVSFASTTTVSIEGGSAYINGRYMAKPLTTVKITGVATADGTYNVVMNEFGNYEVYNDSAAGFSVSDLLINDSFLILAQVTVTGGVVVSPTTDARLFINDTDLKLPLTVDTRDLGAGTFRTLEAAILYSQNAPNDVKREILVLSDITIPAITVATDIKIVIFGDATFSSTITLGTRSTIEMYGTAAVAGAVVMGTSSSLICHNTATFSSTITCGASSILEFYSAASVSAITISGAGALVRGAGVRPTITFTASSTSIAVAGANVEISNLTLDRATDVAFVLIDLQSGSSGFRISDCTLQRSYGVVEASWATASKSGLKITGSGLTIADVVVKNCVFDNFAEAISGHHSSGSTTTMDNWIIDGCLIKNSGIGIYLENAENVRITNNLISFIKTNHVLFATATTQKDCIVSGNVFETQSSSSTTLIAVSIAGTVDTVGINGNIFRDFTGSSAISIASATGTPKGIEICDNIMTGCTTNNTYAFDLANARTSIVFSNNTLDSHSGKIITISDCVATGNVLSATYALATGTPAVVITNSTVQPIFSKNKITTSTGQTMSFVGSATITGNSITTDSIAITSLGFIGLNMSGNDLYLIGTAAVTGVSLDTGATYTGSHIFSNNIVCTSSTTNGLLLSLGIFSIIGNSFSSVSGNPPDQVIKVGSGTTNASAQYKIDGNLINADTGSDYAILIDTNNVSIVNNHIFGSGMANQAIRVKTTGKQNIAVVNNFLGGSGNGLLINHIDGTSAVSFYVGQNKNYTDHIQQGSLLATVVSGTWTISSNTLHCTVAGDAVLSFSGLPVGTQIVSVSLSISSATAAASGTIEKRTAGTIAASAISSTVASTLIGYETLTITPTATTYVAQGTDYFLKITSGGVIDVGQIVVNVKY